jgi:hypothetical protein
MDRLPSLRRLPRRSRYLAALLLGVALSIAAFWVGCGDYCLFCDETANPQGPCDGDPCTDIDNAQAGTCTAVGADDFTCRCDSDFFWDDNGNACEDPCIGAPCDSKEHAADGSCSGVDANEYTCECGPVRRHRKCARGDVHGGRGRGLRLSMRIRVRVGRRFLRIGSMHTGPLSGHRLCDSRFVHGSGAKRFHLRLRSWLQLEWDDQPVWGDARPV